MPRPRRPLTLVVLGLLACVLAAGTGVAGGDRPLPGLANHADWRGPGHGRQEALRWLDGGGVPGGARWRPLVEQSLLDLHALVRPNGAVLAGPAGIWRYAWPRDSAFAAAALAASGHADDAWHVLRFLGSVQLADGGFEARYRPDGSGPPDDRARQSDGAGWVLWALDAVRVETAAAMVPADLRPLRDRAVAFVLGRTSDGRQLPPASPDYWEVPESDLTLGTVAPMAAGLDAASRSYAAEGDAAREHATDDAAARLRGLIAEHFGPGYGRYGGAADRDAAVAVLMPPFADAPAPAVRAAWSAYQVEARRPAGGLAPGAGWRDDGISWTPETALVAFTAAASGQAEVAAHWLDWLAAHRTTWGSVPEKVRPDGLPAGPAPLAWTAALVVLTAAELDGTTPR